MAAATIVLLSTWSKRDLIPPHNFIGWNIFHNKNKIVLTFGGLPSSPDKSSKWFVGNVSSYIYRYEEINKKKNRLCTIKQFISDIMYFMKQSFLKFLPFRGIFGENVLCLDLLKSKTCLPWLLYCCVHTSNVILSLYVIEPIQNYHL